MGRTLQLVQLVLPVFLVIGAGYAMRRAGVLTKHADHSLLGVLVKLFVPCLALDVIIGNEALQSPTHLLLPPAAGFLTVLGGVWVCRLAARIFLENPAIRPTFAATTGIQNYAYIALPLSASLFDREVTGVLFAYNLGVEIALWTVVVTTFAGRQPGSSWRRQLFNPPIIAVVVAALLNLAGAERWIPSSIDTAWHMLGQCAVPLGLLVTGAMLADYVTPRVLVTGWGTTALAIALRIGVLPALMLAAALFLPFDRPLAAVMILQAAMPCAVFPIALAKLHSGDMPTALRTVIGTSLVGLVTIPLWLKLGLELLAR